MLMTRVVSTKPINKIPWMSPMACVASGICSIYLTGIATKTRSNNEQPSRNAITLKRPIPDLNKSFINLKVRKNRCEYLNTKIKVTSHEKITTTVSKVFLVRWGHSDIFARAITDIWDHLKIKLF